MVAVRKGILLTALSFFLYLLYRDITIVSFLVIASGIAAALLISRLPSTALVHIKYPFIILSFALSAGLLLYPALRTGLLPQLGSLFLSFYSMALYMVTIEEKSKKAAKEVTGLSLLFVSATCNLFLTGRADFVLPLAVTVALFLFVLNRSRLILLALIFIAGAVVFFYVKKIHLFGGPLPDMGTVARPVLLATAFLLLLASFAAVMKRGNPPALLAFFGLLCLSIDLLLSVGFTYRGLFLTQPLAALLIAGPLTGIMMKEEGSR